MKHLIFMLWVFCAICSLAMIAQAEPDTRPKGETMETPTYSVQDKMVDGFHVYHLHQEPAVGNRDSGVQTAVAAIVPALGNNCYAFRVAGRALIDEPPDLATLQERPTAYGNPILFPFPNRIRDGKWTFEGETYQFDKPPDAPTTIHGLVLNRPYQVQRHTADENGATLVCSLDSRTIPDIGRQYPFPFHIEITYTLKDAVLTMGVTIKNGGIANGDDGVTQRDAHAQTPLNERFAPGRKMPMGFGIHPYFRVANPSQAKITVPAAKYWELDDVLVPTGKQLPVTDALDLRDGKPFPGLQLDHVFTDVQLTAGVSRCIIGNELVMESDAIFRELVVYTPPGRDAICFEPYTCPTDAINLEAKGIPAGIIVLSPGEVFSATVRIKPY